MGVQRHWRQYLQKRKAIDNLSDLFRTRVWCIPKCTILRVLGNITRAKAPVRTKVCLKCFPNLAVASVIGVCDWGCGWPTKVSMVATIVPML